jgi:RNA polymerase sigma factor (sigma-70 family)
MNGDRNGVDDVKQNAEQDADLVCRARQGRKEAFEHLVERYQTMALRIAARLTPNREAAQDLVQETFLEAYLSLRRLRDPEHFKSWLFGILLNLGRNRLRRQNPIRTRYSTDELSDEAIYQLVDQKPDPQQIAEERELHRVVLGAVEVLPVNQRDPIWMFYFEALSLQEIAVILGVSVNNVKVRLHRGRQSLRQKLEFLYPEFLPVDRKRYERATMTKVSIADVIKHQDKTIVMLLSESGDRVLPIWIGEFEGASIVMGMFGVQTPRSMTFDFITSLLAASNALVEEVRVETLKNETFFGIARLRIDEQVKEIDARPSDVLALAVRTGSPIYVSDDILAQHAKPARQGIVMPVELNDAEELPVPTGEGMQAILVELKATYSRLFTKK